MTKFDPSNWSGDRETLPFEELLEDDNLCGETFASKHEALTAGYWHGARREAGVPRNARRLGEEQQSAALDLLGALPWGDLRCGMDTLEQAVRLGLAEPQTEFALWMEEGEIRFGDEFDLTPAELESLTEEWRMAYVARLLRTIALMIGMPTEFASGASVPGERPRTIMGVMRSLDIAVGAPMG